MLVIKIETCIIIFTLLRPFSMKIFGMGNVNKRVMKTVKGIGRE